MKEALLDVVIKVEGHMLSTHVLVEYDVDPMHNPRIRKHLWTITPSQALTVLGAGALRESLLVKGESHEQSRSEILEAVGGGLQEELRKYANAADPDQR